MSCDTSQLRRDYLVGFNNSPSGALSSLPDELPPAAETNNTTVSKINAMSETVWPFCRCSAAEYSVFLPPRLVAGLEFYLQVAR
jgi:hypothetical protein